MISVFVFSFFLKNLFHPVWKHNTQQQFDGVNKTFFGLIKIHKWLSADVTRCNPHLACNQFSGQSPSSLSVSVVLILCVCAPRTNSRRRFSVSGPVAVKHGPTNRATRGALWLWPGGYWRWIRWCGCGKGQLIQFLLSSAVSPCVCFLLFCFSIVLSLLKLWDKHRAVMTESKA